MLEYWSKSPLSNTWNNKVIKGKNALFDNNLTKQDIRKLIRKSKKKKKIENVGNQISNIVEIKGLFFFDYKEFLYIDLENIVKSK